MTTDIDLRDTPAEQTRETLYDAIGTAEPGDDLNVVSDEDVDPHLVRYQLDAERGLEWAYDDPDAEPRTLTVTVGEPAADGALASIDVRDLKPVRRHEALLAIFDELEEGEGFVLVNDHDPKPLYHELRSMHGDAVAWEYANRDDGEWRVEIEKTAATESVDGNVVTRYDVRDIPKQERHPTIHHRWGMIPEGGTMELVAPHEPRPLHREFRQQYGDAFEWTVVDSEPGRCRVHITKTGDTDSAGEASERSHGGHAAGGDADVDAAPSDEETIEVTEELDVRDLPPARRHELIYDAYDDLAPGTGFVLVNDHDPKPLYHQFDAEAGPEFRWSYRQREHGEFRVLIGKATAVDVEADDTAEPPF